MNDIPPSSDPDAPPLIVVAGPTASGKSALALDIAREFSGTVINADSMQVYRELRVLTARPSAEEEAAAPHRLYGVMPGSEVCSPVRWRDMAVPEIEAAHVAGGLPIVCGGTGLYIRALLHGFAPVPEVPPEVRAEARADLDRLGHAAFHERLAAEDPETAARLAPTDTTRNLRAWEVWVASGRSISWWQRQPPEPPPPRLRAFVITLAPPRDVLYARCDARLERMVLHGPALDEVRGLLDLGLPDDTPVMKALGVPELAAHLRGEADLESALKRAQQLTRNYAKRQMTWFRGQLDANETLAAQYSETLSAEIFQKVRRFLLTGGL
ncbi:tRNA (adenosine(37)-N6)-dimethylallyltransferase MiaA [Caenispirillum salinarum]|uniref:tRNA (adenosine(37)-N6)-dimethylallyltransferase MiaA n=1 Tax=Caenispirillum salinarum TaxID=859058 RepID=UPI00384D2CBA